MSATGWQKLGHPGTQKAWISPKGRRVPNILFLWRIQVLLRFVCFRRAFTKRLHPFGEISCFRRYWKEKLHVFREIVMKGLKRIRRDFRKQKFRNKVYVIFFCRKNLQTLALRKLCELPSSATLWQLYSRLPLCACSPPSPRRQGRLLPG